MSFEAVNAVIQHSRAQGPAYTLLLIVATHADKHTATCHPSRETLCREARLGCDRTTKRYLDALEKLGELIMVRGNGRGNLTTYTINLPGVLSRGKGDSQMPPFNGQERVTDSSGKGDKSAQKDDINLSPFNETERVTIETERVTNFEERVTNSSGKGDKWAGAYKDIEPLGTKGTKERETRANAPAPAVSEIFAETFGRQPSIDAQARLASVTDLPVWREVMVAWRANSWSPRNVDAMVREYEKRVKRARDAPVREMSTRTRQNLAAVEQAIAMYGEGNESKN